MSMLNFYINCAGHSLPHKQKRTLAAAKGELRRYSAGVLAPDWCDE